MINFDMSEILVLVVLAVIFFGPEKLPDLARKAARVLNYLRNIANDAQGRLREELGPEFADLELADLNPRALVNKHLLNPVQSELEPVKQELAPLPSVITGSEPLRSDLPANASPPAAAERVIAFDTEAT